MEYRKYPVQVQKQLEEVERIVDGLGTPVDEDIRLTVAVLKVLGFITTGSCAGHVERRTTGPYVWVESKESFDLAPKLRTTKPIDGEEAMALRKEIKRYNLQEQARFLKLLAEFYLDRNPPLLTRISVETMAVARTRIDCVGSRTVDALEDDDTRQSWLKEAQSEFAAFTEFLLKKLPQRLPE